MRSVSSFSSGKGQSWKEETQVDLKNDPTGHTEFGVAEKSSLERGGRILAAPESLFRPWGIRQTPCDLRIVS